MKYWKQLNERHLWIQYWIRWTLLCCQNAIQFIAIKGNFLCFSNAQRKFELERKQNKNMNNSLRKHLIWMRSRCNFYCADVVNSDADAFIALLNLMRSLESYESRENFSFNWWRRAVNIWSDEEKHFIVKNC